MTFLYKKMPEIIVSTTKQERNNLIMDKKYEIINSIASTCKEEKTILFGCIHPFCI